MGRVSLCYSTVVARSHFAYCGVAEENDVRIGSADALLPPDEEENMKMGLQEALAKELQVGDLASGAMPLHNGLSHQRIPHGCSYTYHMQGDPCTTHQFMVTCHTAPPAG